MIQVTLYGKSLGFIIEQGKKHRFEFSKEWLESGFDISPVLYGLEHNEPIITVSRKDSFMGIPEFLSDALPDKFGNKVIDAYFLKKGIAKKDITVLDRLAYLGKKAIGALEFAPAKNNDSSYQHPLVINKLVSDARSAINGDISEVSQDLIQVGSSAGGARPKALICANSDFSDIRSGLLEDLPASFEHYLIKFDGVDSKSNETDPKGYSNIEYAYYLMAKDAGIEMSPCFLVGEGARQHFVTKRFDRLNGQKRHIQTLCAMTGLDFNDHQAGSYSDYFSVLNVLNLDYVSKLEAFRRMVFNVLAVNRDDHTKNFSFILEKDGTWKLAPAYDITHAYNEKNPNAWTREHNLLINGKGSGISKEDLIEEAQCLELKEGDIERACGKILTVLSHWESYASKSGVLPHKVKQIKQHMEDAKTEYAFAVSETQSMGEKF